MKSNIILKQNFNHSVLLPASDVFGLQSTLTSLGGIKPGLIELFPVTSQTEDPKAADPVDNYISMMSDMHDDPDAEIASRYKRQRKKN